MTGFGEPPEELWVWWCDPLDKGLGDAPCYDSGIGDRDHVERRAAEWAIRAPRLRFHIGEITPATTVSAAVEWRPFDPIEIPEKEATE